MGYNSIIYIAALASVDPQLEEAATIDGANRLQKIWHIDLPTIMPTIIIMLILRMGSILDVGYEKVYLMQNDINIVFSEVISTYVYKMGLLNTQYSFAAAVGIFNSVVNLVMVLLVNWICRRLGDTSLW
jgi:putative aldouronate transport system permease protein